MVIGLSTKNKLSFVDGSLSVPLSTDTAYRAWVRCNDLVIGWILGVLGPVTKKSVFFYKSTREIWQDLEERYGQVSSTELYGIQEEISAVHQETEEIDEFFAKIKVLWDQLDDVNPIPVCTCSGCVCNLTGKFLKIQQDSRLLQFLMKLKDEYKQVRSNILMMQPLPTLTLAYRMLLQEQKHKQISDHNTTSTDGFAFAADRRKFYDNKGFNNNRPGYQSYNNNRNRGGFQGKNVRNSYKGNMSVLFCDHCKMTGHLIDRCFKLHGYPNEQKGNHGQKRFANMAQGESYFGFDDSGDDNITTTFSRDQYNKFMNYLDNSQEGTVVENTQEQKTEEYVPSTSRAAYFADNIPFERNLEDSFHLASTVSNNNKESSCTPNNDALAS
ncbi:uncharacterized protein LOC110711386 [Chenopodium quinoa]|uniref:uncharacterized protein LOC110711386 n=1 Tax=Chenopodium quinoa TaxID=63459 RepID=UPI000B76E571|nr:uncharacterized protein LOC110711386 [Chenopodium quinoa]